MSVSSNKLKSDSLSLWETLALSVAIMGPSASISITVLMMAMYTGFSAPLIYLMAMMTVLLVSVSIIKLNQHFPSSGSVYGFAEKTLGLRSGFVSGWLIVFAYLMLGVSCAAVACSDFHELLLGFGLNLPTKALILPLLLFIWYLAHLDAKASSRVLLFMEGFTLITLVVLSLVILGKASAHQGLSLVPFSLEGVPPEGLAAAMVFGFLAFSGFEGASSLGEESHDPKKMIPLAIATAIILSGLFYIIVSYAQIIGFGVNEAGLTAIQKSAVPLATLTSTHLGDAMASLVLLCIGVSFSSATLGCLSAGSRILFAMSRDGLLPESLSRVHPKYQTPSVALGVFLSTTVVIFAIQMSFEILEIGRNTALIGTLALLCSYMLTTLGALVYFKKKNLWRMGEGFLALMSLILLVLIFMMNIFPVPEYPMNLFPYIVLAWIALGTVIGNSKHKNLLIKKRA